MKKIILSLVIIALIFSGVFYFIFKDTKEKDLEKITLAEVTHSVFYTPLYVAIENNYFEKYGIDLELILASGADKVSAAVLSGDTEIGLAGSESAIYIYDAGQKDYLQIFSGLTKRDGQFIVSRKDEKNFTLENLYGKEILVGRSTGMPALNFLNALKNEGIDKDKININYSIDFASLSGSFIGGEGNYVNLFEPTAYALEKEKQGYVVSSIGKLSGEMPYTVFYAKKSYIENNKEIIINFTKAINDGLEFVRNNSTKDIAKVILPQFADTSIDDLEVIVKRYKDNDSWLDNNVVSEKLLQNIEDLLIDNNLLKTYVNYNDLVINPLKNVD